MKPYSSWIYGRSLNDLSVSSNGSTWVKLLTPEGRFLGEYAFSILERIDVGETSSLRPRTSSVHRSLSVSSNGSTWVKLAAGLAPTWPVWPFSILERIDVGETFRR